MQPHPKKSNRPLPDGWDEKDIKKQLEDAYDEMFGEFTENGVLKVTPEVVKRIIEKYREREND